MVWSFCHRLRSCAEASPSAVARREAAACRAQVERIIAQSPRPMTTYDVSFDADSGAFGFRHESGSFSLAHPAVPPHDPGYSSIPAYSRDMEIVEPLWPPSNSSWVLVPEASGAWCYYDTALGLSSWFPPDGSAGPQSRKLLVPDIPFQQPPPRLDDRLTFVSAERADWMPEYHDFDHVILMRHRLTGAVREAPWISLRTPSGQIYFGNLTTRDTRWFPPHRWMDGWVTRNQDCPDGNFTAPPRADAFDSANLGNSTYSRYLLPTDICRLRVEGGAPYLHSYGVPQYGADKFDSAQTYPMAVIGSA